MPVGTAYPWLRRLSTTALCTFDTAAALCVPAPTLLRYPVCNKTSSKKYSATECTAPGMCTDVTGWRVSEGAMGTSAKYDVNSSSCNVADMRMTVRSGRLGSTRRSTMSRKSLSQERSCTSSSTT